MTFVACCRVCNRYSACSILFMRDAKSSSLSASLIVSSGFDFYHVSLFISSVAKNELFETFCQWGVDYVDCIPY